MNDNLLQQFKKIFKDAKTKETDYKSIIDYKRNLYSLEIDDLKKSINEINFRIEDINNNPTNAKSRINENNIASLQNENENLVNLISEYQKIINETKTSKMMYQRQLDNINEDISFNTLGGVDKLNVQKMLIENFLAEKQSLIDELEKNINQSEILINNNKKEINKFQRIKREYNQNLEKELIPLKRNLASKNNRLNKVQNSFDTLNLSSQYFEDKFKEYLKENKTEKDFITLIEDFQKYVDSISDKELSKSDESFDSKTEQRVIDYYEKLINFNKEEIEYGLEEIKNYENKYNTLLEIYNDRKNDYDGITKLFEDDIKEITKQINLETDEKKVIELNKKKHDIEHHINVGNHELFDMETRLKGMLNSKKEKENVVEKLRNMNKEYEESLDFYKSRKKSCEVNQKVSETLKWIEELGKKSAKAKTNKKVAEKVYSDEEVPEFFENKNITVPNISDIPNRKNINNETIDNKRTNIYLEHIPADDISFKKINLSKSDVLDNNLMNLSFEKSLEQKANEFIENLNKKAQKEIDEINSKSKIALDNLEQILNPTKDELELEEDNTKNKKVGKKLKAIYNASKDLIKKYHEKLEKGISISGVPLEPKKKKKQEEIKVLSNDDLKQIRNNCQTIYLNEVYRAAQKDHENNENMPNLNVFEVSKPGQSVDEALRSFKNKLTTNYEDVEFVRLNTEEFEVGSRISQTLGIDKTSGDLYALIPKAYYKDIMQTREQNYTEQINKGRKK